MHAKLTTAAFLLAVGAGLGWLAGDGSISPKAIAQAPATEKTEAGPSRYEGLSKLPFEQGFPTKEASQILRDELLFQRAVQGYLWSLPAVNMWAMKEGSEKVFGGGYNVLPT